MEKMGIPTAPVEGMVFEQLIRMHTGLIGMPRLRVSYLPHPTSRVPAATCRKYIEGKDPVSGRSADASQDNVLAIDQQDSAVLHGKLLC